MHTGTPGHLKSFDYVGLHRYFGTFCTLHRDRLFIAPDAVALVRTQILRAATDQSFEILTYCFMPDHVHLLAQGESDCSDGRRFFNRAKQLSGFHYSKQFGRPLWQRYGYERVLRDDEETLGVARYVLENPVRGGLVTSAQDYEFSGSTRYTIREILDAVCWRGPRSG